MSQRGSRSDDRLLSPSLLTFRSRKSTTNRISRFSAKETTMTTNQQGHGDFDATGDGHHHKSYPSDKYTAVPGRHFGAFKPMNAGYSVTGYACADCNGVGVDVAHMCDARQERLTAKHGRVITAEEHASWQRHGRHPQG
jgi:hypothetical protein